MSERVRKIYVSFTRNLHRETVLDRVKWKRQFKSSALDNMQIYADPVSPGTRKAQPLRNEHHHCNKNTFLLECLVFRVIYSLARSIVTAPVFAYECKTNIAKRVLLTKLSEFSKKIFYLGSTNLMGV